MIYIFLADGFEDIEAIVPMDVLKRAKFNVQFIGVGKKFVTSAHGLKIESDFQIDDIATEYLEAIVLPGGMPGTINLDNNEKIHEMINYCIEKKILIGAICAAPMILGKTGVLNGKKACCYPGFEHDLTGAEIVQNSVCMDGQIITSRGPGTALEFAFAILEKLKNKDIAESIKKSMIYV